MSQVKEQIKYTPYGGRISEDVKSHSKDPHVIEKGRLAMEMLKKTGLPKLPENKKSKKSR